MGYWLGLWPKNLMPLARRLTFCYQYPVLGHAGAIMKLADCSIQSSPLKGSGSLDTTHPFHLFCRLYLSYIEEHYKKY